MNATEALRGTTGPRSCATCRDRDEVPLTIAYELGRRAVADRLSMLELVEVHHERSAGGAGSPPDELDGAVEAASEFFLEVLATYHMVHGQAG